MNRGFLEFIELLDTAKVEYLIVGGYAVGFHGFPRYTGNIDFFVAVRKDNARKLLDVFERFGFGNIGFREEDFLEPDFVVEIGREPQKIQVLTGIDGVSFEECQAGAIEVVIEGVRMRFIGREDLIRNKLASGRGKDLIDAEELGKLGGE